MPKKVEIYTTNHCVYCTKAKELFKKENVEYTEYNIEKDIVKRDELVAKSGQFSVPLIIIDGKMIIGYDQVQIKEALTAK